MSAPHAFFTHYHLPPPLQASSSADADPAPAAGASDPLPVPAPAAAPAAGGAVSIPAGVPPAGAVFVLAGFLKLMIMCFPFSTMAISMYLQGRADLGAWAVLRMLPAALAILALAKTLLDRGAHRRRWFAQGVAAAGVAALLLSRWAFARPRPSPLDPMLRAYYQREVGIAAAAQAGAQAQAVARGAPGGGRLLGAPDEAARAALRDSGTRFKS